MKYTNKKVDYCIHSISDGNIFLEVARFEEFPEFIGSPTILIGDIDVYDGVKNPGHCVPTLNYALQVLNVARNHWLHLSWVVYQTPGGLRFICDTVQMDGGEREMIMQTTCCDPIYRLICKRRGYYSARILPKGGRDVAVLEKIKGFIYPECSDDFRKLVELHDDYVNL